MFFFSLALFGLMAWISPWWVSAAAAFVLGLFGVTRVWPVTAGAAVAWAALAYVQDGRSYGLISRRLSGLFQLPHPTFMFVVMALIGGVTVLLCLQSGRTMRALFSSPTHSPNSLS